MFKNNSGRGRHAAAWTASLALASASVTGLVLAPAAGAASAHRAAATGFVEICKRAADQFTTGTVRLTITNGAFRDVETVLVGQCTGPIRVPAGQVTIIEKASGPTYLKRVRTTPAGALLEKAGNTVLVRVAASRDSSRETLVTLWNAAKLGSLKVCKTLTSNSASLIAQGNSTFTFNSWYMLAGSTTWHPMSPLNVTVLQRNKLTCALSMTRLPIGTKVRVQEQRHSGSRLTGVQIIPASQNNGSTRTTANLRIGPFKDSVTSAAFTNMAVGTVEICKAMDDSNWSPGSDGNSPYNGTPFQFRVNNGRTITVRAGACSGPITVPAGTATVQEIVATNFHLLGWTAVGPDDSSRLTSSPTSNPITVSVPAGGVGNETLVTATNQVNVGRIKVCKILSGPPSGKTFSFTTTVSLGDAWTQHANLTPSGQGSNGEDCTGLSPRVPVVSPGGALVTFTTTEGPSPFPTTQSGDPTVEPVKITYDGNGQVLDVRAWMSGDHNTMDGKYHLTATVGQGVNLVTFVNGFVIDP